MAKLHGFGDTWGQWAVRRKCPTSKTLLARQHSSSALQPVSLPSFHADCKPWRSLLGPSSLPPEVFRGYYNRCKEVIPRS